VETRRGDTAAQIRSSGEAGPAERKTCFSIAALACFSSMCWYHIATADVTWVIFWGGQAARRGKRKRAKERPFTDKSHGRQGDAYRKRAAWVVGGRAGRARASMREIALSSDLPFWFACGRRKSVRSRTREWGTGHARNVLCGSRRSADAPAAPRGGQGLQRHLVHDHPHFLIARRLVVVEVLPSNGRARCAVSQPAARRPHPPTLRGRGAELTGRGRTLDGAFCLCAQGGGGGTKAFVRRGGTLRSSLKSSNSSLPLLSVSYFSNAVSMWSLPTLTFVNQKSPIYCSPAPASAPERRLLAQGGGGDGGEV